MRILVTRAIEDAGRTASALRAMGHEPVIAPLRTRVVLEHPLPEGDIEGVIATSRHAFSGAPLPAAWHALPCYCVGETTAKAARTAGFGRIAATCPDSAALVAEILARCESGTRLLYLAGSPRHPALEEALAGAGHPLVILPRYEMQRAGTLPENARAALTSSDLDAVLHYSAKSARAFFELAENAGLSNEALKPLHLCLSPAVSDALPAKARRRIAQQPHEEALLDALHNAPLP